MQANGRKQTVPVDRDARKRNGRKLMVLVERHVVITNGHRQMAVVNPVCEGRC